MGKHLLYRLFKAGALPREYKAVIEAEGIILIDEGLQCSVTYKKYKAPGKYFRWKRRSYAGSLAVTKKRIIMFAFHKPLLNVPFSDMKSKTIEVKTENHERLCISFDASEFDSKKSGTVECRCTTPVANLFLDILKQRAS